MAPTLYNTKTGEEIYYRIVDSDGSKSKKTASYYSAFFEAFVRSFISKYTKA